MNKPGYAWLPWLIGLTALSIVVSVCLVFVYVPTERVMGPVQRIFYFHVPSAWVGFLGFFVTFVAGILYLASGKRIYDIVALSSVEVGLTFISMAVLTGPFWARPVWGTYWTWEPRLTISAIQLLVYIAYIMLRSASDNPAAGARFAVVYGIVAFVTVPLSWFAIRWWRAIHPDIVTGGGGMAMEPKMLRTLMFSLFAFTVFYVTLMRQRVRIERAADEVASLRAQRAALPGR